MFFVIGLVIDILFTSELYKDVLDPEATSFVLLTSHIVCGIVIAYFIRIKIQYMYFQGLVMYFKSRWNLADFLNSVVYIIYITVLYTRKTPVNNSYLVKTFQCIVIVLSFIKVNFYLRIFEGLSFLVQMLPSVINDLKWFLLYFLMFIFTFAMFLLTLIEENKNDNGEDQGLGVGFYQFVLAFRTSVGDFDFPDYAPMSNFKFLMWGVWFFNMFVGYVIFMNFIIAVVNESYEGCMNKMVGQSYKVKVDVIAQRESIMTA